MLESRIKELLKERGIDVDVKKVTTTKNNGVLREGVMLTVEGSPISPTIYYDGEKDEEQVAEYVADIYMSEGERTVSLSEVFTKDYVLGNVYPAIVSREKNAVMLECIPHRSFLNLEVVYKFDLNLGDRRGSVTVDDRIAQLTEVTEDELYEAARANIDGHVFNAVKMLMPDAPQDLVDILFGDAESFPMRVVTNTSGVYGAGVILDDALVESIARMFGGEFYLIPSSVHEWVVIPTDTDPQEVGEMISSVNRDVVPMESFLSDNLYIYRNGRLEVAA